MRNPEGQQVERGAEVLTVELVPITLTLANSRVWRVGSL